MIGRAGSQGSRRIRITRTTLLVLWHILRVTACVASVALFVVVAAVLLVVVAAARVVVVLVVVVS